MGTEDIWQLIVLIVLIALSAFFSASETALMSLSKIRIRSMVNENVPKSKKISDLVEKPGYLLGAILVGNNIVNIGASALATSLAIKHFGNTGVGIATGVITLLVLIFGEITPKSLAAQNSEKVSLKVVSLLSVFVFIFKPITIILVYITNGLIKLFGGKTKNLQSFVTEEEIKTMINVGHEEGVLEAEEKEMIHNVFEFGDSKVADVMTPRTYMVAVERKSSYESIIDTFRKNRYSRLPVYEDNIDNIVGIILLADLFLLKFAKESFDITKCLKEPYITYEYYLTNRLFRDMRNKGVQMAIVIDEYGGTAGVITIEDIIEEIVGDIHDETDEIVNEIEVVKEGEYVVIGIAKIDIVNDMLSINIDSDDFETIGGFVLGLFGKLPEAGQRIEYNNMIFIVEKIHRNRIEKLRILTY